MINYKARIFILKKNVFGLNNLERTQAYDRKKKLPTFPILIAELGILIRQRKKGEREMADEGTASWAGKIGLANIWTLEDRDFHVARRV